MPEQKEQTETRRYGLDEIQALRERIDRVAGRMNDSRIARTAFYKKPTEAPGQDVRLNLDEAAVIIVALHNLEQQIVQQAEATRDKHNEEFVNL